MQRTLKYIRNGRKPGAGIFACCLLTLCLLLLLSTGPAFAKTVTVDTQGWAEFRSIQAAVDQAENGDTVFVYAGEFNENVLVDKSLMLIAENGAVSSETSGFGSSDRSELRQMSPEISQITPEISQITPEISQITPEISQITPEINRITEEFDLNPEHEILIYVPPSIKKASSASLLLILDAAGQIDLLEEIENGSFSDSEKLLLGESVRQIRRKCPIGFLRQDQVVYSYLISPDRSSDGAKEGSFAEEAGFENLPNFNNLSQNKSETQSKNLSEAQSENVPKSIPEYRVSSSAPSSVRMCLNEDENRTLDRIQEASSTYWEFSHSARDVDLENTYFESEDVDSEGIEYGKSIPDADTGEFIIFETRFDGLSDRVVLIPANPDYPAFEILADNVTVQGFEINPDWNKRPEIGFLLQEVKNCTLLKNRVSDMEFGILLRNCTGCVLKGNLLDSTNKALMLENSNRNLLRANSMERGRSGIYLKASDENRLFENRARDFSTGFRIDKSRGNALESNSATCNTWAGFYLLEAEDNLLGNNSAKNNWQCGVSLERSSRNILVQNDAWDNINGISLEASSRENSVHDNQLFECEKGLLVSEDSTKNHIYNNTIRLNRSRDKSWFEAILDQIFI